MCGKAMRIFKYWITKCSEQKVSTIIQIDCEGVGAILVESLLHLDHVMCVIFLLYLIFIPVVSLGCEPFWTVCHILAMSLCTSFSITDIVS